MQLKCSENQFEKFHSEDENQATSALRSPEMDVLRDQIAASLMSNT